VESACSAFARITPGQRGQRVVAVGLATTGVVDSRAGVLRLRDGPGVSLREVPLAAQVEARLGLPVIVAERPRAFAMGEYLYGAGEGTSDLAYVSVSGGVNVGIIAGGRMVEGGVGGAGELGHVVIVPDGPRCTCGARGCLRALASGLAILQRVRELARAGEPSLVTELTGGVLDALDLDEVRAAAAAGDALVLRVLDEAGGYLGQGLAVLLNVLNPQLVVLGGPTGQRLTPYLLPAVERAVRANAFSLAAASARVVAGTLGDDAGIIGAGALAWASDRWTLPASGGRAAPATAGAAG
jgi:glucokinase